MRHDVALLSIAVVLLGTGQAAGAASFACPASFRGASLDHTSPTTLFDGKQQEMASLAPDTTPHGTGWLNSWTLQRPGLITAVCAYVGGGKLAVELAPDITHCTQAGEQAYADSIICR